MMQQVKVVTFGYLHDTPPEANITIDLRKHFRDPHVNPRLRYMTADDPEVRRSVLGVAGMQRLIESVVALVHAYRHGPGEEDSLTVAVGCSGGRHRAPTVGREIAAAAAAHASVTVEHRDLDKPVIERPAVA